MTLYTDLKDGLIKISDLESEEVNAEFEFSRSQDIFTGHFPDRPILPGIAQIEMVKLILEESLDSGLTVKTIKKTKFSHQIDPGASVHLSIRLTEGLWSSDQPFAVRADIKSNGKPAGRVNLLLERNTD